MIKFEKLPADIVQRLPGLSDVLSRDENVIFAYLFGGLARGEVKPLSDVDIALYVKQPVDIAECKLRLYQTITDALGTDELDLVMLNTAPVSLTGRIVQNRQVIVDKAPFLRHAYESLTLREFFDFKIKEDRFFKERYGIG